jgi:hypothetical protein
MNPRDAVFMITLAQTDWQCIYTNLEGAIDLGELKYDDVIALRVRDIKDICYTKTDEFTPYSLTFNKLALDEIIRLQVNFWISLKADLLYQGTQGFKSLEDYIWTRTEYMRVEATIDQLLLQMKTPLNLTIWIPQL